METLSKSEVFMRFGRLGQKRTFDKLKNKKKKKSQVFWMPCVFGGGRGILTEFQKLLLLAS